MGSDFEGAPLHDHHHHEAPAPAPALFYRHNHLPFFLHHHHHLPPPAFLSHAHHHHFHLPPSPPIPFLCARCKCWNFPAHLNFNADPDDGHLRLSPAEIAHHDQVEQPQNVNHEAGFLADGTEEEEQEEEDYEFVMTDEWTEFFAKSEARRQEKKRQQKKAAKEFHKAESARWRVEEPSEPIDEECAHS